jgi:hypothetical protein
VGNIRISGSILQLKCGIELSSLGFFVFTKSKKHIICVSASYCSHWRNPDSVILDNGHVEFQQEPESMEFAF